MADSTRPRLTALRNGLLGLHQALMESERAAYERDVARITSTGQYLGLVLNDPWFQWLRDLSQFVVRIDVTLDDKEQPAAPPDAERLISEAKALLLPAQEGPDFARRYYDAMQRDPAVVLAHRDMMQVLGGL
jgi:hypothetical protein